MIAAPQRSLAEMLTALVACDRLNDWERTAFDEMHARVKRFPHGLSQKQLGVIRDAFERYDLETELPAMNLVSEGRVPRGRREVPVPEVLKQLPKRPPGR